MSVWLSQHLAALRLALRRLVQAPANALLSLITMGVALALPVGGVMIFASVQHLAHDSKALPRISVFMKLDASRATVSETGDKLNRHPAIESVQFLPREATLKQMRQSEGLADVIDALPHNPFPDAFVITPKNTQADEMEKLAADLRGWPPFEHVQIDSTWVRRLNAMMRVAWAGLGFLSLLLGIGLLAVIFNTIRLQVLTLRNEIEISLLLGATDAFISRPFFYFGMLQGALGGVAAWLIAAVATWVLRAPVADLANLYGLNMVVELPGAMLSAALFVAAAGLGWFGAWLSLRRHLYPSTARIR